MTPPTACPRGGQRPGWLRPDAAPHDPVASLRLVEEKIVALLDDLPSLHLWRGPLERMLAQTRGLIGEVGR